MQEASSTSTSPAAQFAQAMTQCGLATGQSDQPAVLTFQNKIQGTLKNLPHLESHELNAQNKPRIITFNACVVQLNSLSYDGLDKNYKVTVFNALDTIVAENRGTALEDPKQAMRVNLLIYPNFMKPEEDPNKLIRNMTEAIYTSDEQQQVATAAQINSLDASKFLALLKASVPDNPTMSLQYLFAIHASTASRFSIVDTAFTKVDSDNLQSLNDLFLSPDSSAITPFEYAVIAKEKKRAEKLISHILTQAVFFNKNDSKYFFNCELGKVPQAYQDFTTAMNSFHTPGFFGRRLPTLNSSNPKVIHVSHFLIKICLAHLPTLEDNSQSLKLQQWRFTFATLRSIMLSCLFSGHLGDERSEKMYRTLGKILKQSMESVNNNSPWRESYLAEIDSFMGEQAESKSITAIYGAQKK